MKSNVVDVSVDGVGSCGKQTVNNQMDTNRCKNSSLGNADIGWVKI